MMSFDNTRVKLLECTLWVLLCVDELCGINMSVVQPLMRWSLDIFVKACAKLSSLRG